MTWVSKSRWSVLTERELICPLLKKILQQQYAAMLFPKFRDVTHAARSSQSWRSTSVAIASRSSSPNAQPHLVHGIVCHTLNSNQVSRLLSTLGSNLLLHKLDAKPDIRDAALIPLYSAFFNIEAKAYT